MWHVIDTHITRGTGEGGLWLSLIQEPADALYPRQASKPSNNNHHHHGSKRNGSYHWLNAHYLTRTMTLWDGHDYCAHSLNKQTESRRQKLASPGSLRAGFPTKIILEVVTLNSVQFCLSSLTDSLSLKCLKMYHVLNYIINTTKKYKRPDIITTVRLSIKKKGLAEAQVTHTWLIVANMANYLFIHRRLSQNCGICTLENSMQPSKRPRNHLISW